ncbi:MAG: hypothetical protein OEW25_01990 [Nitrospira sp.]|nr:hypothetical protein [Nitrospira sp.]MDH4327378.1 hypothetical protein [Nitrospira sp.]MDH5252069.1 hypothetical protein [Nitrospira sp.]
MSFVAVAGATVLSVGGSIFGGIMGASAEKRRANSIYNAGQKGADDIQVATGKANTVAKEYGDMARGELSPFRDMGVRAGTSLANILMGGEDASQLLKASPLFKFQSELGSRNINRELSARGMYGSGAGLETLARFNDQLVGEEGQRMADRLFSLTGLGANAATNMARGDLTTGDLISGNTLSGGMNAANMRYNSTVGAANAVATGDRMLGQMGQDIFNTVGQGLMSYGNYSMNLPMIESATKANNALAKKYGMTEE